MYRIFIFLLCFYFVSAKIQIKELDVPESIENGSVDDVILDCEYEVVNDSEIEVKWYFRNDTNIIYQWLPDHNHPPQAMGTIKHNIDAGYKISSNKKTMYRALHIVNITPELSGNYSCKVSGINGEDVKTKPMVIYDPPDTDLDLEIFEEDSLINCTVGGVFPRPEMRLYIFIDRPENETDKILFEDDDEVLDFDEDDGTYNVTSTLYYDPANITGPFTYVCELTIPGTNYSSRAEDIYILEENDIYGVEEQIEDYLNSIDSTESEESANNSTTQDYETQIEEGLQNNSTISAENDESDDTSNESDKSNSDDSKGRTERQKSDGNANVGPNYLLLAILILLVIYQTSYLTEKL